MRKPVPAVAWLPTVRFDGGLSVAVRPGRRPGLFLSLPVWPVFCFLALVGVVGGIAAGNLLAIWRLAPVDPLSLFAADGGPANSASGFIVQPVFSVSTFLAQVALVILLWRGSFLATRRVPQSARCREGPLCTGGVPGAAPAGEGRTAPQAARTQEIPRVTWTEASAIAEHPATLDRGGGDDQGAPGGSIHYAVGCGSDPGIVRGALPNEDTVFLAQGLSTRAPTLQALPVGFFLVADGMGGHAQGRVASRMAARVVSDYVLPPLVWYDAPLECSYTQLLADGVQWANHALFQRNRERGTDAGTTVCAALVVGPTAYVVNVGDSRMYLYRVGEGLSRVTADHSLVAQLVLSGELAPDAIYSHPQRNLIYRRLGGGGKVPVDSFVLPLRDRDILLFCSDGLWEVVHDQELEHLVETFSPDPGELCQQLTEAALQGGGPDNISMIAVSVLF